VCLRDTTVSGQPLQIRGYQKSAAEALVGNKGPGTGFGTIVLPCGAGKTIVGMQIMAMLKTSTLIITTNISAVHQWMNELLDKTTLPPDQIAEYTGEKKTIKQVTVATYQILTWRPEKDGPYPHFALFRERPWGLIIYDEVHMLPAPVFRVAAELQAVRRVGLTATLVREDGCEGYVFSLVGPKRYDVPWKELEHSGWIATAECIEIRLDLAENIEVAYAVANARLKHRIASENPVKEQVVQELIRMNPDDKILVIGQYLDQLQNLRGCSKLPSSPEKHRSKNATGYILISATVKFKCLSCQKWLISRSICPTRRSPSRCPERSAADRRKRSVSDAFSARKNGRPASLRSLHGTPSKKISAATGRNFWPNRDTPTALSGTAPKKIWKNFLILRSRYAERY